MYSNNLKLHEFQIMLIAKLTKCNSARFNELLIENLESEHMNYHLKKLQELGLVTRVGSEYTLTNAGKDYSNLLDDNIEIIERQPKTSVLLHAIRHGKNGEIEHLLNKRLRQPYLHKVGRLSGKVRFGESLEQAAARELYEETGLIAQTIVLEEIYHRMRFNPPTALDASPEYVQDVLFLHILHD